MNDDDAMPRLPRALGVTCLAAMVLAPSNPTAAVRMENPPGDVELLRVPAGGLQPMAEIDEAGTLHLIYFAGEPMGGDVYYVTRKPGSALFSTPIRVNGQPGSAIATGTVRGAQLARGRDGRVHVAWMGSSKAAPRGPKDESPMLYTGSIASGAAFEPQRNLVQHAYGLDGGGTVAADTQGRVYVAWHAGPGERGEESRHVWLSTSTDDGATFDREVAVTQANAGVCGCCGMKASVDRHGVLRMLYRAFSSPDHRDMYLLTARPSGGGFDRRLLARWQIGACPMSTASASSARDAAVIAWETNGEVAWATVDATGATVSGPISPPAPTGTRKHPSVATRDGEILLVWTEGMGWARGGSLHWAGFDRAGKPTRLQGQVPGVPVWSRPATLAHRDGFTILY